MVEYCNNSWRSYQLRQLTVWANHNCDYLFCPNLLARFLVLSAVRMLIYVPRECLCYWLECEILSTRRTGISILNRYDRVTVFSSTAWSYHCTSLSLNASSMNPITQHIINRPHLNFTVPKQCGYQSLVKIAIANLRNLMAFLSHNWRRTMRLTNDDSDWNEQFRLAKKIAA